MEAKRGHPYLEAAIAVSDRCKGELGKLKIETVPHHIKEFVALKPKLIHK